MDDLKPPLSANSRMTTADKRWKYPHRSRLFWIIILIIVVIFGLMRQQQLVSKSKQGKAAALPLVVVMLSNSKDVPIYITALGSVTPTYSVTVKTQINGQLLRVLFKEGQIVKQGDLLAEIDNRPYLAQLTEYEGEFIRDSALLANARIDLKRYQVLWKQDSVSQQTLATQKSLVHQYEGAVKTDEGLVQATRVNLIYCRITSPISGRVGLRLVDPGNFVQTSDTSGIVIINMINPITVVFTIPEDDVPKVIPKIYANKTLLVQAYDRQQNKLLASGALLTIDNQINSTTGTVKLKANFNNENNALFPDQFVNINLLIDTLVKATVVPTAAVQHSVKGDFVYLLNSNQTVSVNPVMVDATNGENTVIAKGLRPGQLVVVEGADKLTDGAKVAVANTNKPPVLQPLQTTKNVRHGHFFL